MHYQFEAIHPFIDGNGRVVTSLITLLLLCARGVPPELLLYLSAFFPKPRGPTIMRCLRGVTERSDRSDGFEQLS